MNVPCAFMEICMHKMFRLLAALVMCALLMCSAPAFAVQADTVTKQCMFEVSAGREKYLTDGDVDTSWTSESENGKLMITLPTNGAGYVVIEWEKLPTGYIFAQYDADKQIMTSVGEADVQPGLIQVYELNEDARYVLMTLTDKKQSIAEITVYSPGELPESVQRWRGQYTKCDMMLVCAYAGDEFSVFGGMLPRYAVEKDARVQTVFMTEASREQKSETLAALWSLGIDNYPEFLDLSGSKAGSLEDCLKKWGGKDELIGTMVECIRRFKPEVIVSHDINGEGGDYRRQLTGMLMEYAIAAAADPDAYPDSGDEYGAWQVKKLYLHLGQGERVDLDWSAPAQGLPGGSALAAAQSAFASYASLAGKYTVTEGGEYDSSVYSLISSTIGSDVRRDDLFENVPGLDDYEAPEETAEAEASVAPSKTPALVFSPEPTEAGRVQPGAADEFGAKIGKLFAFIGICLGLILLITCCQALIYHFRGKKRRRRR